MRKAKQKKGHKDEPVYWFGILEIAREQKNADAENEAVRHLQRLGIKIVYLPSESGVTA
jgi:hypothetical protein